MKIIEMKLKDSLVEAVKEIQIDELDIIWVEADRIITQTEFQRVNDIISKCFPMNWVIVVSKGCKLSLRGVKRSRENERRQVMDKIIIDKKILRQISRPAFMSEIKELRGRLRKAIKTAWTEGSGLAAIQIGIPLRFAWLMVDGRDEILLNPKIMIGKGKRIFKGEGCLSIPHSYVDTERYYYIEYISEGKLKKAMNFKAILIQHEIDHMDGILNIDRR